MAGGDIVFVEIDGYKINYETVGTGEDVVILHGWGYDITLLYRLRDGLKDFYRVTLIDLPGHGRSDEPQETWTVYRYARCVLEVLDKLSIHKAYYIGHSFGCRLALIIAANEKHRVKRMVLCGAAGIKPKREIGYYFKVYSYKIAKLFVKVFAPKKFDKWRQGKGSADYQRLSECMRSTFSAIVNEDLTYLLPSVEAPVFLIWGEKDTATPLYMARIMEKEIPDCAKAVYMGRTHYAFLEELPRTLAIVKTFFKE